MPISLIFFSSAEISLPLFKELVADDRFEIKAIFCQPDKPAGRKLELKAPAPKLIAKDHGIPVYQPEKLSTETELLNQLQEDPPDFLLTFAYGQIMRQEWLDLAAIAPLNVHTSLLPKYRGASPIQSAILNGDNETGISLMKMVLAMDAGPVAFQDKVQINDEMNAGDLHDELANLAALKVPNYIVSLSKDAQFTEQDESLVSHCGKVSREDGFLDFKGNASDVVQKFKAYSPWPGVWTKFNGKRLKVLDLSLSNKSLQPGQVLVEEAHLFIGCSEGSLQIHKLQLEGKSPLLAKDFLLGQSDFDASTLPS